MLTLLALSALFLWASYRPENYALAGLTPVQTRRSSGAEFGTWHKGGGAPRPPSDAATKKQVEEINKPLPPVQMPKPLPPPPPPSQNMDSVQQAAEDQRRRSQMGRGLAKTLLAGETGGYKPMEQGGNGGKRTLLG
jgi:hypothetical protein